MTITIVFPAAAPDLRHDVFYLVYFAATIALVTAYVRVERVEVAAIFRERWRWSLGVDVAFTVASVTLQALLTASRPAR